MLLIIGGSFQGKKAFAKELTKIEEWEDGMTCDLGAVYTCKGIFRFHEYIRRLLESDADLSELAESIIAKNPDLVLVSNELGYGVVPIDKFDRKYRETTGRVMTKLAAFANEVYRVTCGIPMKIKG